jgi:hypothetical protein
MHHICNNIRLLINWPLYIEHLCFCLVFSPNKIATSFRQKMRLSCKIYIQREKTHVRYTNIAKIWLFMVYLEIGQTLSKLDIIREGRPNKDMIHSRLCLVSIDLTWWTRSQPQDSSVTWNGSLVRFLAILESTIANASDESSDSQ